MLMAKGQKYTENLTKINQTLQRVISYVFLVISSDYGLKTYGTTSVESVDL